MFAKAIKAVAIAKIRTVCEKVLTRPILSPKIPKQMPPKSIPKLVIEEISEQDDEKLDVVRNGLLIVFDKQELEHFTSFLQEVWDEVRMQ